MSAAGCDGGRGRLPGSGGTVRGMNASEPSLALSELAATITATGTLPERMGIEIIEATPERVVGVMPVAGNAQPYGLLHGGASCVLAETLGSIGAALHAMRLHGGITVGVDINATHHKGVRSGHVTGVATPLQTRRQRGELRGRHHRRDRRPRLYGPADLLTPQAFGRCVAQPRGRGVGADA